MTKRFYIYCFFLLMTALLSCTTVEEENPTLIADVMKTINGEPVVPRSANTIYLAKIKNMTGNELLGGKLSLKLKDSINGDGRLAAVQEKENADLALDVTVKEYTIQNLAYDSNGQPVGKRMKISVSAFMTNLSKKTVTFYDPMIQAFMNFSEFDPPIKTESDVLDEVTSDLAKRITAKALSGWYTQFMTPAEKGKR